MRILDWNELDESERRAALARPAQSNNVSGVVLDVIASVRQRGDAALRAYTKRFDGVDVEHLQVSPAEFQAARRELTSEQIDAIGTAISNVERFHAPQMPYSFEARGAR